MFICVVCTLRTRISRSICNFTHVQVRHCFLPAARAARDAQAAASVVDVDINDDGDGGSGSGGVGDADAATDGSGGGIDDAVLRSVTGKLGELEAELLRSQQTVSVPRVALRAHAAVEAYVSRCAADNVNADVDGLTAKVTTTTGGGDDDKGVSAAFLNAVQRGLLAWKRDIRRLTTLERDVSSGDSLAEVNFTAALAAAGR
jgi:hypothetical protein